MLILFETSSTDRYTLYSEVNGLKFQIALKGE